MSSIPRIAEMVIHTCQECPYSTISAPPIIIACDHDDISSWSGRRVPQFVSDGAQRVPSWCPLDAAPLDDDAE